MVSGSESSAASTSILEEFWGGGPGVPFVWVVLGGGVVPFGFVTTPGLVGGAPAREERGAAGGGGERSCL